MKEAERINDSVTSDEVPFLTVKQMIKIDELMVGPFEISLIQMMENAGRNLACVARSQFLNGDADGKSVIVLAGTGGNGGGALVAARRLSGWGAHVSVFTTKEDSAFGGVPAQQLAALRNLDIDIRMGPPKPDIDSPELIIDGIIGYSLRGAPRGIAADLIRWANESSSGILSLDAPSGLNLDTGMPSDPSIKANATMTLALPKVGLAGQEARSIVGDLYLADIGVPQKLYRHRDINLTVGPLFSRSEIVPIALPPN